MSNTFTICVLLYGDHRILAQRCLSSITNNIPREALNLRVGLNAVSDATRAFVDELIQNNQLLPENVYDEVANIKKYPMMRKMLWDPENPIETPFVMWFDDDSYLDYTGPNWLEEVDAALSTGGRPHMLGSIYSQRFSGNQADWLKAQPWYTGREFERKNNRDIFRFATGGWWCVSTEVLRKWNWPDPAIVHRGGDCALGELLRQQGLRLQQFRKGVRINADASGRESKARRRGHDEKPVGHAYTPSVVAQLPVAADVPVTPAKSRNPYLELDL